MLKKLLIVGLGLVILKTDARSLISDTTLCCDVARRTKQKLFMYTCLMFILFVNNNTKRVVSRCLVDNNNIQSACTCSSCISLVLA